MKKILLWLAAAWLGVASGAAAQLAPPPDPDDPALSAGERLEALVERVRHENRRIRTLEAAFTQHKESLFLVAPLESRGSFSYAAPDRVRWEYTSPNPVSLVIAGEEMTTWYRDLGQVERLPVGRKSQRILKYMGAGSSLETLLEYFTVTLHRPRDGRSPFQLDLDPRFEKIAARLASMSLWIDRERFLPVRLRYVEADGDLTDYRFSDFKVNRDIPEERFRLDLPREVKVRVLPPESPAGLR